MRGARLPPGAGWLPQGGESQPADVGWPRLSPLLPACPPRSRRWLLVLRGVLGFLSGAPRIRPNRAGSCCNAAPAARCRCQPLAPSADLTFTAVPARPPARPSTHLTRPPARPPTRLTRPPARPPTRLTLAVSSLYLAVALLPLADASVLSFLSPLFVAVLRCAWLAVTRHAPARCDGTGCRQPWRASRLLVRPSQQQAGTEHLPASLPSDTPPLHPPARSPLVLKERPSRGTLVSIPMALVGVVLVAHPSFVFGGGGGIRCAGRGCAVCRLDARRGAEDRFPPRSSGACRATAAAARTRPSWHAGRLGHALHTRRALPPPECPPSAAPRALPRPPPSSALGIGVGVAQALFNSLARMAVRALRWARAAGGLAGPPGCASRQASAAGGAGNDPHHCVRPHPASAAPRRAAAAA